MPRHPAPWRLEPIGSATTSEECTGVVIVDADGVRVFAIRPSDRTSKWNGLVPKEVSEAQEGLLQRIVDAINKVEAV